MTDFFQECSKFFYQAIPQNLPAIPQTIKGSTPISGAPYLISFAVFTQTFKYTEKHRYLLLQLKKSIALFKKYGFEVVYLIVGGSILFERSPNDLDCILFYKIGKSTPNTSGLLLAAKESYQLGIDIRTAPIDSDPLILAKMIGYFTILYSLDSVEPVIVRGPVIVDCRDMESMGA